MKLHEAIREVLNIYGSNLPVERVSWEDCQQFIQKLQAPACPSAYPLRRNESLPHVEATTASTASMPVATKETETA